MTDRSDRLSDGYPLEDCEALEYILLGDLRDLLEEPFDEENCRWMIVILDALLQTKRREFELQERDGYLAGVLEECPNWEPQVDRLYRQDCELFGKLHELRDRIAADAGFAEIAETVRADLRDWMATVRAHHRHCRRLVHSAYTLDVGVGD